MVKNNYFVIQVATVNHKLKVIILVNISISLYKLYSFIKKLKTQWHSVSSSITSAIFKTK